MSDPTPRTKRDRWIRFALGVGTGVSIRAQLWLSAFWFVLALLFFLAGGRWDLGLMQIGIGVLNVVLTLLRARYERLHPEG